MTKIVLNTDGPIRTGTAQIRRLLSYPLDDVGEEHPREDSNLPVSAFAGLRVVRYTTRV